MSRPFPDMKRASKSTELITRGTTDEVIYGGSPAEPTTGIGGTMLKSLLKTKSILSQMLFQNLPTYLVIMGGVFLKRAIRLRILLECGPDLNRSSIPVFDLVNCGPNTRFQTSTGLIAHNCLGLSYSMGPKKMVKSMYEAGHILTQQQARDFYTAYWSLFSGVQRFSKQLTRQLEVDGYIVNPFGYRLSPDPRLAFNYFIQSSVSGIVHVLCAKLFAAAPYVEFVTVIHDEVIVSCPLDKVDQFRVDKEIAVASLNEDLKWEVPVRVGFAEGRTLYDAK